MNKVQIICAVGTMLFVFMVVGFVGARGRRSSIHGVLASASLLGRDLITKTNSDSLVLLEPGFPRSLKDFLASPARLEFVRQERSQDNRQLIASLWLVNEEEKRLNVQLRWDRRARKFTLVGYTYPAALPDPIPE